MKRRSFTLVEVLVAALVLAVLLPITLQAVSMGARLDEQSAQRRQAADLADAKLRELLVTGDWREAGTTGDFGDDHPDYRWELLTDQWTEGETTLPLLALTVYGPTGDRSAVTLTALARYEEAD